MLPVLYELVLSPKTATIVLFALAVLVPAFMAFRAWQDVRAGLVDDRARPLKVFAGGVAALVVIVAVFVRPWTFTKDMRLPLHTYGLMIAIGFLSAIAVAAARAKREGLDKNVVLDLSFWALVAGLVGSRILFIIVNPGQYFGANFLTQVGPIKLPTLLVFWRGGLVFYGGLLGAFFLLTWYLRRNRLPYFRYADILIASVPLGHFFGRLGCFSAGCCWGKHCNPSAFFATFFPRGSLVFSQTSAATHVEHAGRLTTQALYPTQLMESLGVLLLFAALLVIARYKRFHGQVLISYLILYPLFRTVNETFRGDWERGLLFRWPANNPVMLSTSQIISVLVAALGIGFIVWRLRRIKPAEDGESSGAAAA